MKMEPKKQHFYSEMFWILLAVFQECQFKILFQKLSCGNNLIVVLMEGDWLDMIRLLANKVQ